jgi:HAMP domain-containing protein
MITQDNVRLLKQSIDADNGTMAEEYFSNVHNVIELDNYPLTLLMRTSLRQAEIANNVIETGREYRAQSVEGPIVISPDDAEETLMEGLWLAAAIYVYAAQLENENVTFDTLPPYFVSMGVPTAFLNKLPESALELVKPKNKREDKERSIESLKKDLDKVIWFYEQGQFPQVGNTDLFYQLKDTKEIFYWDEQTEEYTEDKLLTSFAQTFSEPIKIQYSALNELLKAIMLNEEGVNKKVLEVINIFDKGKSINDVYKNSTGFSVFSSLSQRDYADATSLIPPVLMLLTGWSTLFLKDAVAFVQALKVFKTLQSYKKTYFFLPTGMVINAAAFYDVEIVNSRIGHTIIELLHAAMMVAVSKNRTADFIKASQISVSESKIKENYDAFSKIMVEFMVNNETDDEISSLANNFPELVDSLNSLMQKEKAELEFLQRKELVNTAEIPNVRIKGW